MSNQKPGMFERMRSLFRGVFGSWVRGREQQSPEIVYEQAIAERVRQYRELKDAVAGILYMRNKIEGEISDRRAEIARLHDDVRRAVRRGQEETSISLIAHKQALFDDLERAEEELNHVRAQAEEAKENLSRIAPLNLGQASRLSGVSAADISVLMVALRKRRESAV